MSAAILECRGVSKTYGGLRALDDVTFAVQGGGQVFAIIGPNGAGKSTLFDTISGLSPATGGEIVFEGHNIEGLKPHEICRRGIARVFQTGVAFASQSTLTNALVGSTFGARRRATLRMRFADDEVQAAVEALEFCDLMDRQAVEAGQLSVFEMKRLMVASALATRPRLLMLDEPVGGLNSEERSQLLTLLRRVADSGVTILMIEHVIKAVQALASEMLVLDHGQKIAEGPPSEVLQSKRVAEVYLGTAATKAVPHGA
jgi:ABC-type branched-subunit amino acid transport system ATPase component